MWVWRDEFRKAKAHMEFNLTRDMKNKKISYGKYTSSKTKAREKVDLLLNRPQWQKYRVGLDLQAPDTTEKVCSQEGLLSEEEDTHVRKHSNKADLHMLLVDHTQECWGKCLISLHGHSQVSVKGAVWEKSCSTLWGTLPDTPGLLVPFLGSSEQERRAYSEADQMQNHKDVKGTGASLLWSGEIWE